MADVATKLPPLGKGWHNTGTTVPSTSYNTDLEGQVRNFNDLGAPALAGGVMTKQSNRDNVYVLVRNAAVIPLLPKRLVSWAANYYGRRVDGYTCTTAARAAGVVDELWPASGVPVGELFWLKVKGLALCKMPLSNGAADIAEGDLLHAITGATSGATTSGRIERFKGTFSATETTDGTAIQVAKNIIARAASTKLTSSTNADILVALDTGFY